MKSDNKFIFYFNYIEFMICYLTLSFNNYNV